MASRPLLGSSTPGLHPGPAEGCGRLRFPKMRPSGDRAAQAVEPPAHRACGRLAGDCGHFEARDDPAKLDTREPVGPGGLLRAGRKGGSPGGSAKAKQHLDRDRGAGRPRLARTGRRTGPAAGEGSPEPPGPRRRRSAARPAVARAGVGAQAISGDVQA